jgi:ribonucleotide reductase alpha subunit
MKATLIKKAEGWYNLYQDKIGIGSTHSELHGYKLSKQNCDEIFGVTDVEKLADEYIVVKPKYREHEHNLAVSAYKEGFNKAMELNKDKVFTLEDLRTAMTYGIVQEGTGFVGIHSVDDLFNLILKKVSQPTEIEVEIEMEVADLAFYENGERHPIEADLPERFKYKPKLDSEGCLILKKI